MDVRSSTDFEPLDHKTSRTISNAIGERLQELFRPETAQPSTRLRQLLDEMRRRDA